jgi:hypothetical protein
MANTLSQIMTKLLSVTRWTPEDVHSSHARTRMTLAKAVGVAGDAANHFYVLDRFKATDRILSLKWKVLVDDATWDDMNWGIYVAGDWNVADQDVIDENAYADAVDMDTGVAPWAEAMGSGVAAANALIITGPMWEAAGVSAEPAPGTQYDLVVKAMNDPAGGSTMEALITYLSGD